MERTMMWSKARWLVALLLAGGAVFWLFNTFRPQSLTLPPPDTAATSDLDREVRIVTLLPRDAIPAIFEPTFLSSEETDEWYDDDELVIGVEIDGDARAYSIPYLSGHEIVNDTVAGRKIAVTW
jgi:hypothetical protein